MPAARIALRHRVVGTLCLLLIGGCSLMPSSKPSVIVPSPAAIGATASAEPTGPTTGLADPAKKELAMQLVSSAENSSLDWKAQYGYIEDIDDGRGYTGGIIGFTSGTGDMLQLVQNYTREHPSNGLAVFLPALVKVNGSDSLAGLGAPYLTAWRAEAKVPAFRQAQDELRDDWYFNPAVELAQADGLGTLGQFIYYDAMVMHGPGDDPASFGGIRTVAIAEARPPAQGGDETTYLNAFLDVRTKVMHQEEAHADTSRIDDAQRTFLQAHNVDLNPPLRWKTYGDSWQIP